MGQLLCPGWLVANSAPTQVRHACVPATHVWAHSGHTVGTQCARALLLLLGITCCGLRATSPLKTATQLHGLPSWCCELGQQRVSLAEKAVPRQGLLGHIAMEGGLVAATEAAQCQGRDGALQRMVNLRHPAQQQHLAVTSLCLLVQIPHSTAPAEGQGLSLPFTRLRVALPLHACATPVMAAPQLLSLSKAAYTRLL